MPSLRALPCALTAAMLLAACAGPAPRTAASPPAGDGAACASPADPLLTALYALRRKLRAVQTAAERDALLAEHRSELHGGMAMLRELSLASGQAAAAGRPRMPGIGSRAGIPGSVEMTDPDATPAQLCMHRHRAARHAALMEMMALMSDRQSSVAPPAP